MIIEHKGKHYRVSDGGMVEAYIPAGGLRSASWRLLKQESRTATQVRAKVNEIKRKQGSTQ